MTSFPLKDVINKTFDGSRVFKDLERAHFTLEWFHL